jgi:predicted RNA-binding Zn-ribbon protein involved in translation (DUF1610 family)
MTYITPYPPNDAIVAARNWMREHNQPVFILAMNQNLDPTLHIPTCPNCDDVGFIFLRLAKAGPLKVPGSLAEVSTWFDGNGQFGKGWYIIEKTLSFDCPECSGRKIMAPNLMKSMVRV